MDQRYNWWTAHNPPLNPTTPFTGKTVLVTGANSGLGLEAAIKFASLDAAELILGVRSLERGEQARVEICRRSNNSYDEKKVRVYELDMMRFDSVKKFAAQVDKEEEKVDVAVLNAGVATPGYVQSPEGYESGLQVNALSTGLLAIMLLPKLRASAAMMGTPSVLEIVGSVGCHVVKAKMLDLEEGEGKRTLIEQANAQKIFTPVNAYCMSKLFVMYIMEGMVRELEAKKTTSNDNSGTRGSSKLLGAGGAARDVVILATCTALCRTNLGRDFGIIPKLFNWSYQYFFARSAEEGSRSIVSGATLGKEANGQLWSSDVFFR